jgi:hypothetical protein
MWAVRVAWLAFLSAGTQDLPGILLVELENCPSIWLIASKISVDAFSALSILVVKSLHGYAPFNMILHTQENDAVT